VTCSWHIYHILIWIPYALLWASIESRNWIVHIFFLISILVLQHSSQIQHLSTLHVLSWRPNLFSIYIDNEVNDSKLISISAQPTRSAHDSKFINLVCSNHKLISYQPLIDQSSTKSSKLNLKSSSIVNER